MTTAAPTPATCPFAVYGGDPDCGQRAPYVTTLRRKFDGKQITQPRCEAHRFGHNEAWELVSVEWESTGERVELPVPEPAPPTPADRLEALHAVALQGRALLAADLDDVAARLALRAAVALLDRVEAALGMVRS